MVNAIADPVHDAATTVTAPHNEMTNGPTCTETIFPHHRRAAHAGRPEQALKKRSTKRRPPKNETRLSHPREDRTTRRRAHRRLCDSWRGRERRIDDHAAARGATDLRSRPLKRPIRRSATKAGAKITEQIAGKKPRLDAGTRGASRTRPRQKLERLEDYPRNGHFCMMQCPFRGFLFPRQPDLAARPRRRWRGLICPGRCSRISNVHES